MVPVSQQSIFFDFVKTPIGRFQISATQTGVASIAFLRQNRTLKASSKSPRQVQKILERTKHFLKYFSLGTNQQQNEPPIDWHFFTPFERRILCALKKIQKGSVISYSALAERAGVPKAARAVGNALNRNPIPILIPCHRVIHKNQSLGGYRMGTHWKQKLLKLEGFEFKV